ncbi:hypothetical protein MSIBF_A630013 [groundwater metagenome]|uniref:Uncharacterized protein n=1 Tax=groundwater metagenome TaxID=717931 RepID=A0A098EFR3_9ZZZZ
MNEIFTGTINFSPKKPTVVGINAISIIATSAVIFENRLK